MSGVGFTGAWSGTNGGMFKSTDGGNTWRPLTKGLPEEGVTQASIAIAASRPSRVYASVATGRNTGIYRSDDSGENWSRITTDTQPAARIGGGDLPVLTADPKNPDIVYSASVVTWKSTDGGKSWTGIRGAPGGDDRLGEGRGKSSAGRTTSHAGAGRTAERQRADRR